jgi:MacB-like periplasmic core domain
MPARFENVLAPSTDIWTPLQYDLSQGRAWGHHLQTIGRLPRGASVDAATSDVHAAGRAVLQQLRPDTYDRETRFSAVRLTDDLVRGVRPAFAAVLGAVALLLALPCVNVTNLLLAHSTGRRSELALSPRSPVAGATSQLPLSGDADEYGAHFDADPSRPAATYPVFRYAVSPGYLEALGIPLREGRLFDTRDRADAPRVAVISESLARRRFPTGSPVGARLRVGPTGGAPYTIVGVVGSVHQMTLAAGETDAVYTPADQWDFPTWFDRW